MTLERKNYLTRSLIVLVLAMVFGAVTLSACSELNTDSPLALLDESGRHPDGWLAGHGDFAFPDGALCVACHGDDLDGGIAGVSCATVDYNGQTCHAGGPAFHPADWLDKNSPAYHGTVYFVDPAACLACHDPGGPLYNCLECHFSEDGDKSPEPAYTHGDFVDHDVYKNTASESVCVVCHEINIGFGYEPGPDCHNCHALHPDGWEEGNVHGAAAMADPGATTGLDYCRDCHGNDFNGGDPGGSCLFTAACHMVAAPHGDNWQGRHDNTDQDNGPICGLCHLGDPDPPAYQEPPAGSCFTDTLCHGNED